MSRDFIATLTNHEVELRSNIKAIVKHVNANYFSGFFLTWLSSAHNYDDLSCLYRKNVIDKMAASILDNRNF